jgi:hypothetical protein
MATLVKRDRNVGLPTLFVFFVSSDSLVFLIAQHPAVVIWSFCNEGACEGAHETGGPPFQAVAEKFDGTRPVSGIGLFPVPPSF